MSTAELLNEAEQAELGGMLAVIGAAERAIRRAVNKRRRERAALAALPGKATTTPSWRPVLKTYGAERLCILYAREDAKASAQRLGKKYAKQREARARLKAKAKASARTKKGSPNADVV